MDVIQNIFKTVIKVDGEPVSVRTHNAPHADELGPLIMLELAGTEEFLNRYAPNRIIEIGIGGGVFDEHNKQGNKEKEEGQCAATLVAKALGIDKDYKWKKILRFINLNDTKGRKNPRDIAEILKNMNFQNRYEQNDNADWFLLGLYIKYKYDYENGDFTIDRIKKVALDKNISNFDAHTWFKRGESCLWAHQKMFEYASREIIRKRERERMKIDFFLSNQEKIKFAMVKDTMNYRLSAALRAKKGFGAHIAVVRNSWKNIIIAKNNFIIKRDMSEAAAVLRVMEQKRKIELNKIPFLITTDWHDLRADGEVVGAEEWYLHKILQIISNGTITHPNVPGTNLSLEEIAETVKIGMGGHFLFKKCRENFCSKGNKCKWYEFGLQRCRKARYLQFSSKEVLSAAI